MSRRPPKGEVERPPPRNPMVLARVKQEAVEPLGDRPPAANPALVGGLAQDEWQAYADAHREGVEVHDEMHVINFRASPDRDQPPERDQPPVPPMAHEEVVHTEEDDQPNADDEDDLQDVTADVDGLFKCKQCDRSYSKPQRLGSHVRRLHRHEFKYQCSLCERRSKTATARNKHEKQDHGLERDDDHAQEEGQLSKQMLEHIQATSTKPLRNSDRIKKEPQEDGDVPESRRRAQPPSNAPAAKRSKPSHTRPPQGLSLPPPTIPLRAVQPVVPLAQPPTAPPNLRSESSSPVIGEPQKPAGMLAIMQAMQKTGDVVYYDFEKCMKRFGMMPIEVWAESEGSDLLLVRSKTSAMRHPLLPAHFCTFAMPRPFYRAGSPAHLLCYAKKPNSVLGRSLQALCERKTAGHGSLSFEDFVSILAQLRAQHIVALVDSQELPSIHETLGQAPHVDLF